jgi:hypothetical protein
MPECGVERRVAPGPETVREEPKILMPSDFPRWIIDGIGGEKWQVDWCK